MITMQPVRRWDKQETLKLVAAKRDSHQFTSLALAIRAVNARLMHAQYHFGECRRLVANHIDHSLDRGEDIWSISSPVTDSEILSHNIFFVEYEAHMIACAQAIHTVADILAHVLFYALELDKAGAWPRRKNVNLHSVADRLADLTESSAPLTELANLLKKLRKEVAFVTINDLVNHLKHRGGPRATLAIQPADGQPYEMRFDSFLHDEHYPSKGINEWLAPAFQVVNEAVVNVGIALNEVLRNEPGK